MAETGSLIQIHYHDNKEILDLFSENSDHQLLYRGKLLDAAISSAEENFLTRKTDGLYVDGSIISYFSYVNGVLKFKGTTVSQEYDERSVKAMIYELWKEYDEEHGITPQEPSEEVEA